jgi:hypothetical protein
MDGYLMIPQLMATLREKVMINHYLLDDFPSPTNSGSLKMVSSPMRGPMKRHGQAGAFHPSATSFNK